MTTYADLVFTTLPVPENYADAISTRFGERFTLADGISRVHRGVDFAVPVGTPVYAAAPGIIVEPGNDGSFGLAVGIDHDGTRWYSLYAHLSEVWVNPGDRVPAGHAIGLSGNTGLSSGPHLHWQVCDAITFPPDIRRSADPLTFLAPGVLDQPGKPSGPGELPPGPAPVPSTPDGIALNTVLLERFELIRIALDPDASKVRRALEAARWATL